MGRKSLVDRFKRSLTQVGGKSLSVTIPIEYLSILGWQKGEEVLVKRDGQTITIEKEIARSSRSSRSSN